MTNLDNGALIVVREEYDETFTGPTGQTRVEHNSDAYWAVRTPQDGYFYDEEELRLIFSSTYTLSGGEPVRIYDQHDIAGLRKLLDAIEADMNANAPKEEA